MIILAEKSMHFIAFCTSPNPPMNIDLSLRAFYTGGDWNLRTAFCNPKVYCMHYMLGIYLCTYLLNFLKYLILFVIIVYISSMQIFIKHYFCGKNQIFGLLSLILSIDPVYHWLRNICSMFITITITDNKEIRSQETKRTESSSDDESESGICYF